MPRPQMHMPNWTEVERGFDIDRWPAEDRVEFRLIAEKHGWGPKDVENMRLAWGRHGFSDPSGMEAYLLAKLEQKYPEDMGFDNEWDWK